ncbi:hypothetical protein [Winogradskyella luteola]|uniref:Uncharacterized protein n=1 Tax=Winogradskyella luteola TaxID=2828330 RepID=A0A9X1JP63_9FLAO|nr:hypothetical protein [Winogradskyella luteola]MBV7268404.1 hypothetical protein [Winogradskyella luteola]
MKHELTTLLQCTSHQLEMLTIMHYQYWCEMYSKDDLELQKLMANNALFNWWLFEYKKLQESFLDMAEPFHSVASKREMERIYKIETIKIKRLYPLTLLRASKSKTNNIIGNPQIN